MDINRHGDLYYCIVCTKLQKDSQINLRTRLRLFFCLIIPMQLILRLFNQRDFIFHIFNIKNKLPHSVLFDNHYKFHYSISFFVKFHKGKGFTFIYSFFNRSLSLCRQMCLYLVDKDLCL